MLVLLMRFHSSTVYGSEQHGWPYHFSVSYKGNDWNARKVFARRVCVVLICATCKSHPFYSDQCASILISLRAYYVFVYVCDADHLYNLRLAKVPLYVSVYIYIALSIFEYPTIEQNSSKQWHFKYMYFNGLLKFVWWAHIFQCRSIKIEDYWHCRLNTCAQCELSVLMTVF